MKILVAPDSFKGSLTAQEASSSIEAGVRSVFSRAQVEVVSCPMADGGEGSLSIVAAHWGVAPRQLSTEDPLGRPHEASWALSPDGREAVIELAEASGLPLVRDLSPQVLDASTRGTGIIIAEALRQGAQSITLCLGGSATVDGGIGILGALGVRFLDASGSELEPLPRNLERISSIDSSQILADALSAEWILLVDVTNPLTGPMGAAEVFGPQKGASKEDVKQLDNGLAHLAHVLSEATGRDVRNNPGSGAAGGVPAGLCAVFDASLVSGAQRLGELIGLPQLVREADAIYTGEGKVDQQSGNGKVVSHIAALAAELADPPPVICFAGKVGCSAAELREIGITAAFSIANGSQAIDDLMAEAATGLQDVAANVTQLLGTRELGG